MDLHARSIPGFPDYTVNPSGLVWDKIDNRYISGYRKGNGYILIRLKNKDGTKKILLHRLLARIFLPNYNEDLIVRHADGNTANNTIRNLLMTNIRKANSQPPAHIGFKKEVLSRFPDYYIYENGIVQNRQTKKLETAFVKDECVMLNLKTIEGKYVPVRLHELVALCFIPNPLNLDTVIHIDSNVQNNHVSNLMWVHGILLDNNPVRKRAKTNQTPIIFTS